MTMGAEQDRARELPDRWSAKAKADVVLRLLRGDAIDAVSREIEVPAPTRWRVGGGSSWTAACSSSSARAGIRRIAP